MFDKKQFLLFLASAALVAACGGGGNTSPSTAVDGGPGSNPNTGEDSSGGPGEEQASDQQLAGYLSITANQVLYVRVDRDMYLPVPLDRFEDVHGINDVAPGYRGTEVIGEPYRPQDGVQYEPPHTLAPAAPLAAFGVRVNKQVLPQNASDVVTDQVAVGRIAVELIERGDSPDLNGGQPEILRYVIEDVELSTNSVGELSARVLPNAEMHVYGRNAAGTNVSATLPVRTDAVSMLPMVRVPDNYGDDSSVVLLFDFEKAFSQAGNQLDALVNVSGHFDMNVTISHIQQRNIVRPAAGSGTSALPRKELTGKEITVNDQPPVNGAGFVGHAWIRSYDRNPPPDPDYPDAGGGGEPAGEPTGSTNEPDSSTQP